MLVDDEASLGRVRGDGKTEKPIDIASWRYTQPETRTSILPSLLKPSTYLQKLREHICQHKGDYVGVGIPLVCLLGGVAVDQKVLQAVGIGGLMIYGAVYHLTQLSSNHD